MAGLGGFGAGGGHAGHHGGSEHAESIFDRDLFSGYMGLHHHGGFGHHGASGQPGGWLRGGFHNASKRYHSARCAPFREYRAAATHRGFLHRHTVRNWALFRPHFLDWLFFWAYFSDRDERQTGPHAASPGASGDD